MTTYTINIESGRPMPVGWIGTKANAIQNALLAMKAGESFDWASNKDVYRASKSVGVAVKVVKLNGTGYRVWRVK
jgi:hypothetical protein